MIDLQQRLGMSLLLISHDLNLVRKIAQRVCVMRGGQIVEQARCEDLFRAPQHPYSRMLIEAEPSGTPVPSDYRHNLLEVDNLRVWFALPTPLFSRERQYVKAVDGVSFELKKAEPWALSVSRVRANPPWVRPSCGSWTPRATFVLATSSSTC